MIALCTHSILCDQLYGSFVGWGHCYIRYTVILNTKFNGGNPTPLKKEVKPSHVINILYSPRQTMWRRRCWMKHEGVSALWHPETRLLYSLCQDEDVFDSLGGVQFHHFLSSCFPFTWSTMSRQSMKLPAHIFEYHFPCVLFVIQLLLKDVWKRLLRITHSFVFA